MYASLNKTIEALNEDNDPYFTLPDEYFCKAYSNKGKCLAEYETECLDIETYTKAFGIHAGIRLLRYDALWHFVCNSEFKPSENDKKCQNESKIEEGCNKGDQTCEDIKKRLECMKNEYNEKCKNEKFTQFRIDGYTYAMKKIRPQC
uniref:Uncharacterized protein n=1 Tax=Panagrolaimus sp. ES5 TaxID=591445 RepID=A0AC34FN46_9BILA